MSKKPKQSKKEMEISQELEASKAEEILKNADKFSQNQHRKDRKQVPPVARNDLGIGRK